MNALQRRIVFALVGILALAASAPLVFAQEVSIPGSESALALSISPEYPGPNTQVRMKLTSPLYDLENSTITWRANGTVIASDIGTTEASITTGGIGEPSNIFVDVSSPQGDSSAAFTIVPSSVAILWEADTLTPPFYKGRALPTAGSTIRLLAVPALSDGASPLPAGALTYEWRRNGKILGSLSGRGKSSISLPAPTLYGSDTISVVVSNSDHSISGQGSVVLSNTDPDLELYIDHPLFGTLYHRALGTATFIPESEMSFAAFPIFAPARSARSSNLSYEWNVNHTPVAADAAAPNEITINSTNSSGLALIDLTVSHKTDFFFGADSTWQATFTSGDVPANPFYNTQ